MPPTTARPPYLHGFLELCLLGLLVERPDYGLGLAERLAAAGLGQVPGGTLYPSLLRLETQGLVRTEWQPSASGPQRKYYEVTSQGAETAAQRVAAWRQFRGAVDAATASLVGAEHRGD